MAEEPRYWLKATAIPGSNWQKVGKEDWIKAERAAGFRPVYGDGCATGGWSSLCGISGTITYADEPPAH